MLGCKVQQPQESRYRRREEPIQDLSKPELLEHKSFDLSAAGVRTARLQVRYCLQSFGQRHVQLINRFAQNGCNGQK